MPGPFYNNIKGTTAGTPGTGAFTPNAASSGFLAWSTVPTGWWGLVRYDDGSSWELTYSYWNGTTLSRASTQVVSSSSGSQLTLTSAATAMLVEDGWQIMPDLQRPWSSVVPIPGSATLSTIGFAAPSSSGTVAAATLANTNFLSEQPRIKATSATTANAQAGWQGSNAVATSSSAGTGGWQFRSRFGGTTLVTGQRMFCGVADQLMTGTTEPSAVASANIAGLGLDSTDTNFQLLVKDGTTAAKTDTGIPFVVNGWYDVTVWSNPGSLTVNMLLIRVDTGAIWYGSKATNTPVTGVIMAPAVIGGLSSTTGTAFVLNWGGYSVRRAF